MDEQPPILEARGVIVEYPGVRALDRVDFDLRAGEVHAIMGENGAGKSTLINVLSGAVRPAAGTLRLGGDAKWHSSPREAEQAGISTVRQEVDLIPTLSVGENVCLCRQPGRWGGFGGIDHRAIRRRADAALQRLGLRIDARVVLGELPIALQQMVAIARALDIQSRVLILDEPTSSLDADETRRLFEIVRRLRGEGLGIIFISHFIEQVYGLADRITVLRNGRNVGTWPAAELSRSRLVEAMTGRNIEQARARQVERDRAATQREVALSVDGVGRRRVLAPTSFDVARGEALGFAGLLGSGRSELARLVFGAIHPDHGRISMQGRAIDGGVRASIAAGMAFTPDDRREALALDLSVRENIILAMQASRGALRSLPRSKQREIANHYIRSLNIRTSDAESPVRTLSGGNQQKVVLARWLAMQPRVLILDEPARGVDIGARAEIESLIASLRRDGVAIVLISSEVDELARVCDRVLVLRDRAPAGMVEDVSETAILARIAGRDENAEERDG